MLEWISALFPDGLTGLLEWARKLKLLFMWKWTVILVYVPIMILLLLRILPEDIILNPMRSQIMSYAVLALMVGVVTLSVKIFSALWDKAAVAVERRKADARLQGIVRRLITELRGMPGEELRVLKYMKSRGSGGVYIPIDDVAGLILWSHGYIRRVTDIVYSRYVSRLKVRCGCYLYEIEPNVRTVLEWNAVQEIFSDIPECKRLDEYQYVHNEEKG